MGNSVTSSFGGNLDAAGTFGGNRDAAAIFDRNRDRGRQVPRSHLH